MIVEDVLAKLNDTLGDVTIARAHNGTSWFCEIYATDRYGEGDDASLIGAIHEALCDYERDDI